MNILPILLPAARRFRFAVIACVFFPPFVFAQTQFAGVWSGALTPGSAFVIEIGAGGDTARFTASGSTTETLRFVGYNPAGPAVNFWREQDHAAISVYVGGGNTRLSYLEEQTLRTAELTQQSPAAGSIGVGAPPPPTASARFVGQWTGTLSPSGPAIQIDIAPGNSTASFAAGGIMDALTYVGFNPAVPSICYWRAQDHAFVILSADGGGTAAAYLEEGFLRTAALQGQTIAGNLLQNGSFEDGASGIYLILGAGSVAIAPWQITSGGIEVTAGGHAGGPQHGSRHIDLDGFYQAGTIEQTFTAVPGRTYHLSFYMSGNDAGAPSIKRIEVSVGDVTRVFLYELAGGDRWERHDLVFVATAPSQRLVVRSLSNAGNAFGALLDNFSIVECGNESECAELLQALNDALAALATANGQVTSLQLQLAARTTERDILQGQVTGLQQQLATAMADAAALQQLVQQLQTQLGAAESNRAQLAAELAAVQTQLSSSLAQISLLQQQLAACTAQRDAALAQVGVLQGQLTAATTQIGALAGQVTELQQQLAAANTSLGGVTAALAAVEADFQQEFSNQTFAIRGGSVEERVLALANAIVQLNRGRKQGIFDALK